MKIFAKPAAICLSLCLTVLCAACEKSTEQTANVAPNSVNAQNENSAKTNVGTNVQNINSAATKIPNLQAGLINDQDKTTDSPLGKFDFKNYEYPLPHGWEDADGKDAVLQNGKRLMSEIDKKIGLSYVTTKYFDINNDGQDEAIVVLKIDTAGSAIPQIVYVFAWKNDQPELIWNFRTGDRADGGLKDLRAENGNLIVELYGQDRFILGELETSKITNDLEQICCPTNFTRAPYKWNGKNFQLQGKRLTFSTADPNAAPVDNMGEVVEREIQKSKK